MTMMKGEAGAAKFKRGRWVQLIAEWERCGESQRAFCEGRGVPLSSFQWWRGRLKRDGAKASGVSFLPVPVQGQSGSAVIEIELRSHTRLRLEGEAALRAVDGLVSRIR